MKNDEYKAKIEGNIREEMEKFKKVMDEPRTKEFLVDFYLNKESTIIDLLENKKFIELFNVIANSLNKINKEMIKWKIKSDKNGK